MGEEASCVGGAMVSDDDMFTDAELSKKHSILYDFKND
jgi:hypothetical protein